MRITQRIWKTKWWLLITVIFLFAINWLASLYHARIDLTDEKRFTLSYPTRNILKHLDDEVSITVFLKGTTNSGFTKLANSADELLHEFKEIAGNQFTFKFIDPDDIVEGSNVTYGDSLQAMGVAPLIVNAQIKSGEQQLKIYPAALAAYKNK